MKLFLLVLLVASLASAETTGTGLQLSVAGDLLGRFGGEANNKIEPREAEIMFYAPVDTLFDAVLSTAAHNEDGVYNLEMHEAYLGSTKLIPRSRFRVGQYFLGIGRLNRFHRHDWPFTTAPLVHDTFFGGEGISDTGIEYGWLLPTAFYLDLTVGVTNGWTFGHAHNEGNKPYVPSHYARLVTYQDTFGGGGVEIGTSYLGRRDSSDVQWSYFGVDVTAKWREGRRLNWLFQNEFWYRVRSPKGGDAEKQWGFYTYPQAALSDTWSLGARFDVFKDATLGFDNMDFAVVPTVTFKASEFSTIRASYSYNDGFHPTQVTAREKVFELQAIFIIGAHPAHDF